MTGRYTKLLIWAIVYLVAITLIVESLWTGRKSVIARYDAHKNQADWAEWQAAVEQLNARGTEMIRRPPPGREPPSLVLLRDYFPTCVMGILSTFTALFIVLSTLINGAIRTRQATTNLSVTSQGQGGRLMV